MAEINECQVIERAGKYDHTEIAPIVGNFESSGFTLYQTLMLYEPAVKAFDKNDVTATTNKVIDVETSTHLLDLLEFDAVDTIDKSDNRPISKKLIVFL